MIEERQHQLVNIENTLLLNSPTTDDDSEQNTISSDILTRIYDLEQSYDRLSTTCDELQNKLINIAINFRICIKFMRVLYMISCTMYLTLLVIYVSR